MAAPIDTDTWFWVMGIFATAGGGLAVFFNGKINRVEDRKVSKDVFKQFEKGNQAAHDTTHEGITEIKKAQADFRRALDTKQDKT